MPSGSATSSGIGVRGRMNGRSVGALPVTVDCSSGTYGFKVTPPGGESFQVSRSVSITRPGDSTTIS